MNSHQNEVLHFISQPLKNITILLNILFLTLPSRFGEIYSHQSDF